MKELTKDNLIEAIRAIMLTNEPGGEDIGYATLMTGVFISEMSKFVTTSEVFPAGSIAAKRQKVHDERAQKVAKSGNLKNNEDFS